MGLTWNGRDYGIIAYGTNRKKRCTNITKMRPKECLNPLMTPCAACDIILGNANKIAGGITMNERFKADKGITEVLIGKWGITEFAIMDNSIIYGKNEYNYSQLNLIQSLKEPTKFENGKAAAEVNGKPLTFVYSLKDKERFAAAMSYANEQIAAPNNKIKEFRNKCNVCGNVYCYSQDDLDKNAAALMSSGWSALAGVTGALAGQYAASAVSTGNANASLNSMIDYTKCPNCNSKDIRALTEEEWEKEKTANSAPQASPVSSADEILKFKSLLDSGIITQEEFDAKKKQLLGL